MKCGPVQKKRTASATSLALPLRPMGVLAAKRAACSSALRSDSLSVLDVSGDPRSDPTRAKLEWGTPGSEESASPLTWIQPGATQFTLTSGAKALAMAWVSMCRAAFDAQ